MRARFFAFAVVAAGLAGCNTGYVPPPPAGKPGPEYGDRYVNPDRSVHGNLTWTLQDNTKPAPGTPSAAEQEEFKKWQESAGSKERQEFDDWRAWQEWKKKNPK